MATKAGSDFYNTNRQDTKEAPPFKKNFDKAYLIWAAEQSLKRTGFETLDILQLHSPNMEWLRRDDPWEALDKLKQQGKICYAGWSIQSFQETEQAFILDKVHGLLDCIQVRYNLLERNAEEALFPKAQEYGIGVIVRSPLLYGLLTGKFTEATKFARDDHRRINLPPAKLRKDLADMKKLEPLFQAYQNHSKTQVSLAFCVSHPACHTVIPGAKTADQVSENCAAYQFVPIAEETIPQL